MGVNSTPIFFMAENYWNEKYSRGETGWDIGYVSTPLKEYFDQLKDKSIKILIPGAGNGYEAAYLYEIGFKNVFMLDISKTAIDEFEMNNPNFPIENILHEDFFMHKGKYDMIVEQTFFCAIEPKCRNEYANKMYELLNECGKFIGLLFDDPLNSESPPYGGNKDEYEDYFRKYFYFKVFDKCYNSIKPRQGRELFFIFERIGTHNL